MEAALVTQLNILKLLGMKPNYSELARYYSKDRRTVKKYYEGYEGKPKTRNKASMLDQYYDLICTKLEIRGITVKAVYEYLIDQGFDIGGYSNFNKYIKSKGLKPKKTPKGHPRLDFFEGTISINKYEFTHNVPTSNTVFMNGYANLIYSKIVNGSIIQNEINRYFHINAVIIRTVYFLFNNF